MFLSQIENEMVIELQPGDIEVGRQLPAPRSVPPWRCLHQERERPFEARRSRSGTLEVSQARHDKIMRWNDQCSLASRACHIICVPWHRKPTVTVDPEETALDRALVIFPCGRNCPHQLSVPFLQNPFIVPNDQ